MLLAETFVDPSRFAGTCYRASNWRSLGRTRGYSREPGGSARWRENGRPKEVYVYEMEKDAAAALRRAELPGDWRAGSGALPPPAPELRSLHAFLEDMPDFRKARGRRYDLACYAAIMIAARLAGYRGVTAFAELRRGWTRSSWRRRARSSARAGGAAPRLRHYILSSLPPDALDRALGAWTRQRSDGAAPVALDGKDVRGASKQTDGARRMMVAAVEHGTGLVLGQVQVGDKTRDPGGARTDARPRPQGPRGHARRDARAAGDRARPSRTAAPTVVTAVKDNQATMLATCGR